MTGLPNYKAKFREMLIETEIRVSFVAEEDGFVVGFVVMERVDFGEFGKVDKTAVLDTIGVHPAFGGSGIGDALLSQLFMNLSIPTAGSKQNDFMMCGWTDVTGDRIQGPGAPFLSKPEQSPVMGSNEWIPFSTGQ